MVEHGAAKVGENALAEHRDEIKARGAGERDDGGDGDNDPAVAGHHVEVLFDKAQIDDFAGEGWDDQRRDGGDEQEDERQDHADRGSAG